MEQGRSRHGKQWKRRGWAAAALLSASLILLVMSLHARENGKKILTIGVFSGSNWDVAVQDSYAALDAAIEQFEKVHPDVTIHYDSGIPKADYSEYLSQKILKDDAPDLMVVPDDDFDRLVRLGVLEDLDKWMDGGNGVQREKYFQSVLKTGQHQDRQYALPVEAMPYMMFVNKTLLAKELVKIPTENFTFEDLFDICRRVTKDTNHDGVPDQFGIYKYDWTDAAVSAGADLFGENGGRINLTGAEMKQAVLLMQKLYRLNDGQTVNQETFDNGRVAFMPLTLAEYRTYKTYPYKIKKYSNFKWDVIEMPKGPNGGNISLVHTLNVGMSARSGRKKLAWEFLKYLSCDEDFQMQLFKEMPVASVLKSVMESEDADYIMVRDNNSLVHAETIEKAIETGIAEPRFEGYREAMQLIDGDIRQLYSSDAEATDLDNALRMTQRKVRDYLDRSDKQ